MTLNNYRIRRTKKLKTLHLKTMGVMVGQHEDHPRLPQPGKGTRVLKWAAIGMLCGAVGGFICIGWLFAGFSMSLGGGNPHADQAFNVEAGVAGAIGLGIVSAVVGSLCGIVSGVRRK